MHKQLIFHGKPCYRPNSKPLDAGSKAYRRDGEGALPQHLSAAVIF